MLDRRRRRAVGRARGRYSRLPVVAPALGLRRVEQLCICAYGRRCDDVADRLAERLERREQRLAFRERSRVADEQRDDRLAVHVLRQPRRRRRDAQRRDAGQLARRLGGELADRSSSTSAASSPRHATAPPRISGPTGCSSVFEAGDDAEVAAAAAQRPEQIRVLVLAGADDSPVGGDEIHRRQRCRRSSRAPRRGSRSRRRGSVRRCRSPRRSRAPRPGRAAASRDRRRRAGSRPARARCAPSRSTHTPRISDMSSIRPPSQTARPAMLWPPPLTEQRQPVLAREARRRRTTSAAPVQRAISRGPAVDHRVPHLARFFVLRCVSAQHRPAHRCLERGQRVCRDLHHAAVEPHELCRHAPGFAQICAPVETEGVTEG